MAIFGRVQKVDTSWGASLDGIDSTSLWGKFGNWKRSKIFLYFFFSEGHIERKMDVVRIAFFSRWIQPKVSGGLESKCNSTIINK